LPQYDHQGCPSVPSSVFHLLRSDDYQLLKTLGLPPGTGGPAQFLDLRQLVFLGPSITVMDPTSYSFLEKWENGRDFRGLAMDQNRRQAYIGILDAKSLLVLRAESSECAPPAGNPVAFYPGDGVLEDTIGGASLTAAGGTGFAAGRVGQAFTFDGQSSYPTAPWTGHYPFGYRDSSVALYVKFAGLAGEMIILDRTLPGSADHARLTKAGDHRIVFELAGPDRPLARAFSAAPVVANRWYHLCVTRTDHDVALYVDGVLADQRPAGGSSTAFSEGTIPVRFGSISDRGGFLHGKLGEIAFYNRALTAEEIKALYLLRESGPCRL